MIIKNLKTVPSFEAGDKTILKEVIHPKNDPIQLPFSLAHAFLPPGAKSLPHRLIKSEETYTILAGMGKIQVEQQTFSIEKGSVFVVPKNALQSVENTGKVDLEFYCIVSPPWAEEEEEVSSE